MRLEGIPMLVYITVPVSRLIPYDFGEKLQRSELEKVNKGECKTLRFDVLVGYGINPVNSWAANTSERLVVPVTVRVGKNAVDFYEDRFGFSYSIYGRINNKPMRLLVAFLPEGDRPCNADIFQL